jgi:formamidopyrimidine-DNA glycosylase
LGNIYVDEALWESKIHPLTPTNAVPQKKATLLHEAIQRVLGEAITKLGTDFGDNVVHGGMYTPRVYGRAGEKCLRCGKEVIRIVVGQRGTHICKMCQK